MSDDEHQVQHQAGDGTNVVVRQMQSVSDEPVVTEEIQSLLFHGCPSCGMPVSLDVAEEKFGRRVAECPVCTARFKRKAFRRKWLCTESDEGLEGGSYTAANWAVITEMTRIGRIGDIVEHVEEHGIGDYDK